MRQRFLAFVLCILFATPASILRADETEIPLFETQTIGYIGYISGGDDPLDGPTIGDPPLPTGFRATLNIRTLSITSLVAAGTVNVAVLDYHDEIVFYQQMFFPSANTIRQIFADNWDSGSYTLYISSIGYAYQGEFEIE